MLICFIGIIARTFATADRPQTKRAYSTPRDRVATLSVGRAASGLNRRIAAAKSDQAFAEIVEAGPAPDRVVEFACARCPPTFAPRVAAPRELPSRVSVVRFAILARAGFRAIAA